ncbi:hypothetical protein [Azospirillum ramasamyi]|uniref:hypothetical protein n=1 Tax=Azospirillum ramasamyi TaxID=682998 RepID=UPI0013A6B9EE|nr:hypothetical protein [Azospirillum ramasamyi]
MIEWIKQHTGVRSLVGFVLFTGITVAAEETIKAAAMATFDFVCPAFICKPAPPSNNPDGSARPSKESLFPPPTPPKVTRQPEEDKRTKDAIDGINQKETKKIDRISVF